MTKQALETLLREEIRIVRNNAELRNSKAQLYAKKLGARINTRINEDHIWSWITRLISNGTIVSSLIGYETDIETSSAFREAANLLELLSDAAESTDREFARVLAAMTYDLAGYQANAICLMRDLETYTFKDIESDFGDGKTFVHPANAVTPLVKLFLEKKIPAALDLNPSSNQLFLNSTLRAIKSWNLHILRGGAENYLEEISAAYKKSFDQGDYALNLILSILTSRSHLYKKRSLWNVFSEAGKNLDGIWGRYVRLKTSDLYSRNRTKPIGQRQSKFELWESQLAAVRAGVLATRDSFVIQMPTSAGKTLIAELAVLDALTSTESSKCLYIAPFRALGNQVESELREAFGSLGFSVSTLSGNFEVDPFDDFIIAETDVLVSTPEKADILTRMRPDYFRNLSTVIVDEGHLIGEFRRGPQLELLIARMRDKFPELRIIFISAVTPEINGKQISQWLSGADDKLIQTPTLEDGKPWQPTQKVFGVFHWDGDYSQIVYPEVVVGSDANGAELYAFARGLADKKKIKYLTPTGQARTRQYPRSSNDKGETTALVAYEFAAKGPTLVFTPQPDWIISTAGKLLDLVHGLERNGSQVHDCFSQKTSLASFQPVIEWYGENSTEHKLLQRGIGIHHGQLPDALRKAIEEDFKEGRLKVLFANTTVSQGINFPVKYLLIHSFTLRAGSDMDAPQKISKREFWNLVGRAGRAGKETEGQVIFIATTNFDVRNYSEFINRDAIEPLESAFTQLANALVEQRISPDIFSRSVQLLAEPAIMSQLVEETLGTPDQQIVENLIGKTLFQSQILSNPKLAHVMTPLKATLNEVPVRFRAAVVETKIQEAFARTGFSLDSNLKFQEFITNSVTEITNHVTNSDILAFSEMCISFFLDSDAEEIAGPSLASFRSILREDREQILSAWMGGTQISDILHLHNSNNPIVTPEAFQKLMSQGLTYRFPWAITAVLQIYSAVADIEFNDLPEQIRLVPAFLKYGVNNKIAALFISLGMGSRKLAIQAAGLSQTNDLKTAIEWLRGVTAEDLVAANFSAADISHVITTAHNINRSDYAETEWSFDIKGITYSEVRKESARSSNFGDQLELVREPDNQFDPYAIKVVRGENELGYVPRTTARLLAPVLDLNEGHIAAQITNITPVYDWAKISVVARLNRGT